MMKNLAEPIFRVPGLLLLCVCVCVCVYLGALPSLILVGLMV